MTTLNDIRMRLYKIISDLKPAYYMELLNKEGQELYETYIKIDDLATLHSHLEEFLADEELTHILDKHKGNYRVKRFIVYLDRIKKELESEGA